MSERTDKIRKEIGGAEPGTLFAEIVEVCDAYDALVASLLRVRLRLAELADNYQHIDTESMMIAFDRALGEAT